MVCILKGSKVKISKDISITERLYHLDERGTMLSMRGKVYTAFMDSSSTSVLISNKIVRRTYRFALEDVSLVKPLPVPKPVIFDIKNLI